MDKNPIMRDDRKGTLISCANHLSLILMDEKITSSACKCMELMIDSYIYNAEKNLIELSNVNQTDIRAAIDNLRHVLLAFDCLSGSCKVNESVINRIKYIQNALILSI